MVGIRDGIEGVHDGLLDPMNMDGRELMWLQGFVNSEREVASQNSITRRHLRNILADLDGCGELLGKQVLAVDDCPLAYLHNILTYIVAATRRRFHFLQYKRGKVEEFGDEVLGHLEGHPASFMLMDERFWDSEGDTMIYGSDVARYCLEKKPDLLPIVGFTTAKKRSERFFGKWLVCKDYLHPKEAMHRLAELLSTHTSQYIKQERG